MNNPIRTLAFTRGQDKPLKLAQPFSQQAEQAVVGAMLGAPTETYEQLSGVLNPLHMYDPFCRAAYEKAIELVAAGQAVDAVVLASRLEGLIEMSEDEILKVLEEIYTTYPATSNVEGWSDVIIDKYIERSLAVTGDLLKSVAHAQNMSRADKLAQAHRMLAEVGGTMTTDTIIDAQQMVYMTIEQIQIYAAAGGKITGIPLGFQELDELTCGLGAGDLIIIGARPSMGKTAFALSAAKYVCSVLPRAERKGVLLFSMEMGTTQIGMRWLAARYGIPLQHMRAGQISAAEAALMDEASEESAHIPFFLEETASLTFDQLAAKARRNHREAAASGCPLGLIVIDYLQLISDSGKSNANKAERVGEISRGLKQLARELKIPVIALSQLSRDLEKRQDKRPMMSDLRESGALEQDADVIMFLYRDEVYNKNSPDIGFGEVIIAKQRNGGLGTVRLAYENKTTCFRDPAVGKRPAPF